MYKLDFLGIASWLGILTVAIEYYISNFIKAEKEQAWKAMRRPGVDPGQEEKSRRRFKQCTKVTIFGCFSIVVLCGFLGIYVKLVN